MLRSTRMMNLLGLSLAALVPASRIEAEFARGEEAERRFMAAANELVRLGAFDDPRDAARFIGERAAIFNETPQVFADALLAALRGTELAAESVTVSEATAAADALARFVNDELRISAWADGPAVYVGLDRAAEEAERLAEVERLPPAGGGWGPRKADRLRRKRKRRRR